MWKPIPDWPYEVNAAGQVRRVGGDVLTPMRCGRKRKQYSVVRLCKDGTWADRKVHILVLEAFRGPRPPGTLGLHQNDDTTNNELDNLYWGTHAQNADDCRYKGGKLSPEKVDNIKIRLQCGDRGCDIARDHGISQQLVCDIKHGRCYGGPP